MSNRIKHNYIDADQLKVEWLKWRDSSPQIDNRTISNELGQMILDIATHLTSHKQFVGYPQHMKDDMVSDGVMKCIKNLKNIKGEFNGRQIFNYLTRACFTANYDYLSNHYKELNFKKKLTVEALESAKGDGRIEDTEFIEMLKKELEQYEEQEEEV